MVPVEGYSPSYRGKVGTWCRACFASYVRGERGTVQHEPRDCAQCGKSYIPSQLKAAATYCSRLCKDRAAKDRKISERLALKPTDRECLHCGSVLPQSMRADAIFCSEECNYGAHALQRKLRARTGQDDKPGYLRAAICKRDGWRCGICRERVSPSLDWPHPRAASLDHVIPVSRGGSNDPANLRLVHLVCNLRRRNLGGEEQLAMI
jgi:5-methylcytosine-specific restriction endonuclease McrA